MTSEDKYAGQRLVEYKDPIPFSRTCPRCNKGPDLAAGCERCRMLAAYEEADNERLALALENRELRQTIATLRERASG